MRSPREDIEEKEKGSKDYALGPSIIYKKGTISKTCTKHQEVVATEVTSSNKCKNEEFMIPLHKNQSLNCTEL